MPFELKADKEGAFKAIFATFDVVDHDMDVTRPGAFKAGTEVIVGSWGHKSNELPVGKGIIRTDSHAAVIEGEFFLDTAPGRDTYQTVKNLGALGEWSYIYQPTKVAFGQFDGRDVRFLEEIQVYSVDPVLAGAGIDTRTTDIKSLTKELPFLEHVEAFSEFAEEMLERVKQRLDGRAKEGRTLSTANVERLKAITATVLAAGSDLDKLVTDSAPKSINDAEIRQLLKGEWARKRAQLLAGIA